MNSTLANTIPIYNYANGPSVFDPAGNIAELFNLVNGQWKDGSPLTVGGNGYNTGMPINFAFPGDPDNPDDWTYADLEETPESIGIYTSFSGVEHQPGAVNEITLVFSVTTAGTNAFDRVDSLRRDYAQLQPFTTGESFCNIYNDCNNLPSSTFDPGVALKALRVYPNPVGNTNNLKLDFGNEVVPSISNITILDALGRSMETVWNQATQTVEVSKLPAGHYWLLLGTGEGEWYRSQFVK